MKRFGVLLVDDVEDLRVCYRMILDMSDNFEVIAEAGDGMSAIDLAREHQPDLVLLDVSMPTMDGMEALPLIKEASPGCRVVMLSGFEAERLAAMAADGGAVAYLEKGITPGRLLQELGAIMRGNGSVGGAPGRGRGEGVRNALSWMRVVRTRPGIA